MAGITNVVRFPIAALQNFGLKMFCKALPRGRAFSIFQRKAESAMKQGQFFFLSEQYFIDFPDKNIMRSKEAVDGTSANRPCFFAYLDHTHPDIIWAIPISSKVKKYHTIYDAKVHKLGHCNTIRFGTVVGRPAAFLIQNMFPVTKKYITEVYKDSRGIPIQIDNRTVKDVIRNAKEVLARQRRGANIIFPDVNHIYNELIKQLEQEPPKLRPSLDQTISKAMSTANTQKTNHIRPTPYHER